MTSSSPAIAVPPSAPVTSRMRQDFTRLRAGQTVGEALANLVASHPDLRKHLYTEEGKLRAFVNVYVNDEDMRYLEKEATLLSDGDTISIIPSIAGGSESIVDF